MSAHWATLAALSTHTAGKCCNDRYSIRIKNGLVGLQMNYSCQVSSTLKLACMGSVLMSQGLWPPPFGYNLFIVVLDCPDHPEAPVMIS